MEYQWIENIEMKYRCQVVRLGTGWGRLRLGTHLLENGSNGFGSRDDLGVRSRALSKCRRISNT